MIARVLVLCVVMTACRRPTETLQERARPSAPPITADEPSAPVTVAALPIANPCSGIVKADAAYIAARWPTMIGHRVRLRMRIERAVDFTLAIGVSGGKHFAVVLSPDAAWPGMAMKTFTVTGSRPVRVGGRSQLPELLLEEGDACDE